jgi:putative transcriptional regulator
MTRLDRPKGETDWERIRAMSDADRLAGAQADPDAQPLTEAMLARARRANDVKAIRSRTRMTQAQFSAAFRVPLSTLRDWEQGRTQPDAPARALLTAIATDPEAMRRLVGGEAA